MTHHQDLTTPRRPAGSRGILLLGLLLFAWTGLAPASDEPHPRDVEYPEYPPAPDKQTWDDADQKSKGCVSCHTETDKKTMHENPGVVLGCTDCHGGDATVFKPDGTQYGDAGYREALDAGHVQPLYPELWNYPKSSTAAQTYTLLNLESPEFARFINPGDYRIAREACGSCHLPEIRSAERSLMATTAMLWGGASYNNGILPFKRYLIGESYTREGLGGIMKNPVEPTPEMGDKGVLAQLYPLPTWQVLPPVDVFRVFERGGRNISNLFPETGLPNALGLIQRLEEPGRPDVRQSNRGPGTGARIVVPVINIHKTRLNDPTTWFLGTNEQPGDYRSSGCSACHVVYANNRDPRHSGPYAKFGHTGETQTVDPTIPKNESGHPIEHRFTRAIPTSQCMVCHMHQPNVFVNSYLGFTMWDYESDAPLMWPEKQVYASETDIRNTPNADPGRILGHEGVREINDRNPEEAAIRGKWSDPEFLKNVWTDVNPNTKDTKFADYHGHGWNFRAIFKRGRDGTLLDKDGNPIDDNDPNKFDKTVLMSSIHLDVGMHCVDCHFAQDSHGNGHIYGEVAQAIEIDCIDCHGTVDAYPNLKTSGPAAPPGGTDLSLLRTQDGRSRFEWRDGKLYQRAALDPNKEWEVSLVKDVVNPAKSDYNAKAARAKTVSKDLSMNWGLGVPPDDRAHKNEEMVCFTCHSSWITGCGGCHLPIQANWKTRKHHYEYNETRNYATYNPQVVRDQMYQLGRHGPAKGNRIAPVRSSSALVLSSTNSNRERIYIQQAPVAASGFSSQAFAPHFAHTVRKTETKTCSDCHLSEENDNNAIMAQLLLQGTNFVGFVGFNSWVGTDGSVEAVRVTEWEEPQAVVGSFLHKYAYPDWYKDHQDANKELQEAYTHNAGRIGCLQLRGEYLYVADSRKGMEAYDVMSIANKGFSQRFITAPFSAAGHDTVVETKHATCVALPTNQPIHPDRQHSPGFGLDGKAMEDLMRNVNLEQDFLPIYDYAFVTDAEEGLIAVDINTLSDQEPRNNFLTRAMTWNENGVLDGARHITIGGSYFYIAADAGLVVLDMADPMKPKLLKVIPLKDVRASALQFRYLFVTDAEGFKVIDVTTPERAHLVPGAFVPLDNGRKIYVARTYAYVAAKNQGLAIIDVTAPEKPKVYDFYTADGQLNDAEDVVVATTNASAIGYVADGKNGLKVLQLTSPEIQPKFYGFSPQPKPELIAWHATEHPALALSKGLDRDRAVDETGGQIAIFGRVGSRPFNREEMEKLYLDKDRKPWYVTDEVENGKRVDK
ncbi:MAG: hypothetical protein KDH88_13460 [Chromatiales bacterium]|nr:hypothetical protein [Chromatiales bacterium]